MFGLVLSALSGGASWEQSLKFVPTIYTVHSFTNLLSSPEGMAVDAEGKVYVVDTVHSKVWLLDTTQTVSLFAGRGSSTYTGDNGLAENATLASPQAVAADLAGNVYIADTGNFAVRRVDAVTGIINTIAGGNGVGYSGDNGPATSAKFMSPSGLAVDPAGNIYVSDSAAGVVRKISTTGTITTFAGGGSPSTGNGDGGSPTSAKLQAPYGLALDAAGSLYIADTTAGVVRKVSANGVITTFAGSTVGSLLSQVGFGGLATSAKLRSPHAVTVDSAGLVYIADAGLGFVATVDATGTINILSGLAIYGSVGDGFPASEAPTASPFGIAVDPSGNVFISSQTQNAVYEIVQHPERFPMTKAGNSTSAQRLILENTGTSSIALSKVQITGDFATTLLPNASPCTATTMIGTGFGNFCTLDVIFTPTAAGIRTFPLTITSNDSPTTLTINLTSVGLSAALATTGGEIFTVAGEHYTGLETIFGDNVPATQTQLNGINGLTTDSAGNIYFTEYGYCLVRRIDAKTGILTTVAGVGYTCPAVAAGPDGGPATQSPLYLVGDVTVGPDGTIYFADDGQYKIRSIDAQGNIHTLAGNGNNFCAWTGDGKVAVNTAICGASGLATDKSGNVYYTDPSNEIIVKVSPAGILTRIAGVVNTSTTGSFSGDGGLAVNANLYSPWGIAVDKNGNIFFSDRHNDVVRRIDATTGIITTVAGTPNVAGYSGDGGPATSATISFAQGVALDNAGNLYISDSQNNVIRRVDATTGFITTVGGNAAMGNAYNGDGLPATETGIDYPETIAVDPSGYVLFSDLNQIIREISPNGTLRFGNQNLNTTSSAQTITVSNIGNMPLHFDATTPYTVTGDFAFSPGGTCNFTQALAVGASCTVQLTFTPTAAYGRFGALGLYSDGIASPQLTQLIGVGTNPTAPLVVLAPTVITFNPQNVGTTSAPASVTVTNTGNATLNISGISFTGTDPTAFAQTTTCNATLAAASQCTINVTFTPGGVKSFAAFLSLADDAVGTPQTVTLTGTGISQQPQALLTPSNITFAPTTVGVTTASQTIVLSNPGNATLNITGIALTGTNPTAFALTNGCGQTLAASASCNLGVTFTPTAASAFTASVSVADNASGSPQSATLSGTGIAAPTFLATLTPSTVAFGSQLTGTASPSQTLTLTNTGNSAISITGVTLSGANPTAFGLTSACGSTLAAGANCTIAITFTPSSAAAFAATVTVADNASGSPQTSALTGTGTAPPDFTTASPTPPQTVTAGGAASYLINVTSTIGNFNLPVTLTAVGLPPGATATFTPPVVTPGTTGATSTMLVQTVATRAGGMPVPSGSNENIFEIAATAILACLLTMRRLPRLTRSGRLLLIAILAAAVSFGIGGCGGGFPLSSPTTYVITVTGTNGTDLHSTSVTLTVQ